MASQTLATTEALVIDGTNGVTRASREGFPEAPLSLGLAGAALVLTVFVVRRAPKWLPLILFAPAAFGLGHVFVARGDAPAHRRQIAAPIAKSLEALQTAAPWPIVPISIVREDDDVTFPLSRYAVPTRPPVDGGVQLSVQGASLPLGCQPSGAVVGCAPEPAR